jgi:anti-sigma regulatory factor (Ser/Thr protein kinase)
MTAEMAAPARGAAVIRRFPGTAEAAHGARDFVRLVLAGHPAADDADLCVTELVANAVAYTRSGRPGGTVTVTVQAAPGLPGAVVVAVWDGGGLSVPVLGGEPGGLAEHGRGLRLVDVLADEWGTAAGDAPGPCAWVTWFRCGVPGGDR